MATRDVAALLECKDLGQHGLVLPDGGGQLGVVWPGIGKNHVVNLKADPGLGQFVDELGLRCAGPWPRTDLSQAFFVNVDNDEAALVFALGGQAPGQVGQAFVKSGQGCLPKPLHTRPHQEGEQDGEAGLASDEQAPRLD